MVTVQTVNAWPFGRFDDGSLPSGATVTDRQYALLTMIASDGVISTGNPLDENPSGGSGGKLAVTQKATPGMGVTVAEGRTKVRGVLLENPTLAGKDLDIGAAPSSGNSRYDLIVARIDWTQKAGYLAVVPGAAATTGTQVVPAVTRSNTIWEQPLALVTVASGDVAVLDAKITNWRMWGGAANAAGVYGAAALTVTSYTTTPTQLSRGDGTLMQIALTTDGRPVLVTAGASLYSSTGSVPTADLGVDVDGVNYLVGTDSQSDTSQGEHTAGGALPFYGLASLPLLSAGRHIFTLTLAGRSTANWGVRQHRWLEARELK